MSVLGKLKERNVFRIGMAYVVAAWVLIQIADVVLKQFAIDPWAIKFIVFLCLAGFPFAVWLSWTFALTPEGLRLERFIDRSDQAEDTSGKRLEFIVQEIGRETNTIGSKANDAEISQQVVEVKTALERVREQVQNVE